MARKYRKDRGIFAYRLTSGREQYGVRLYHHGTAHKWSGFTRKQDARAFYEDRRRDIREERPFSERHKSDMPLVGELIDRYLVQATNKKNYAAEVAYGTFWTAQDGTDWSKKTVRQFS